MRDWSTPWARSSARSDRPRAAPTPSTLTYTAACESRGGAHSGDGDEAEAGVAERLDALGEHLAQRLVDAPHPLGRHG